MSASSRVGPGNIATLLNAVAATGAGSTFQPLGRNCTFELIISNTATVKLQVSFDGSTWLDLPASSVSATALLSIGEWYPYVRANVTAWTSGTVTVRMAVAPEG